MRSAHARRPGVFILPLPTDICCTFRKRPHVRPEEAQILPARKLRGPFDVFRLRPDFHIMIPDQTNNFFDFIFWYLHAAEELICHPPHPFRVPTKTASAVVV